jgi:hypothetical protein
MTSPTPASLDTIADRNSALIRKALGGAMLLGPWPAAPVVATLTATGGQIVVDADYESVGWIAEDGLSWEVDQATSEVRGWGSGTVLRRDINSETETVQFTALETKRLTKELQLASDLSATTMSAAGEVVITSPTRPATKYWRALAIASDGDGAQRYYMAKYFPKASAARGGQVWSGGDDPLGYDTTLTAYVDDVAGFAVREFLFGPGALAAASDMGWTLGT